MTGMRPSCHSCGMMQVDDFDVPASSDEDLDDLDLGSSSHDDEGIDEDAAFFGSAGTVLACLCECQVLRICPVEAASSCYDCLYVARSGHVNRVAHAPLCLCLLLQARSVGVPGERRCAVQSRRWDPNGISAAAWMETTMLMSTATVAPGSQVRLVFCCIPAAVANLQRLHQCAGRHSWTANNFVCSDDLSRLFGSVLKSLYTGKGSGLHSAVLCR